jgi:hypothetical protein
VPGVEDPRIPNLPPDQDDQGIEALSPGFVKALTTPDPPCIEVLLQTRLQVLEAAHPKTSKPNFMTEDTSNAANEEALH